VGAGRPGVRFTGFLERLQLRYENERGNPPASLIAKLPMAQDDAVSGYRTLQERHPALLDRLLRTLRA
jgi:hypothetical protein